jgi:hypothetical protein
MTVKNCRWEKKGGATGGATEMTRPVEVLEKWLELPAISHGGGEPPVGEEGGERRSDEASEGAEVRWESGRQWKEEVRVLGL